MCVCDMLWLYWKGNDGYTNNDATAEKVDLNKEIYLLNDENLSALKFMQSYQEDILREPNTLADRTAIGQNCIALTMPSITENQRKIAHLQHRLRKIMAA